MNKLSQIKTLGKGGMAEVILVKEEKTGRYMAYKQLHEYQAYANSCLEKEIQLLSSFAHPQIPKFEGRDANGFYMSYIKGTTLAELVQSDTKIEKRIIKRWLCQCCDILQYLHTKGYVYLDMKPQNLMLDDQGDIVLIDFGSCMPIHGTSNPLLAFTPRLSGTRVR